MSIPKIDPTNINSDNESTVRYLSSDNSENRQHEGETPPAEDPFSEYLWMENEEEFDEQFLHQLEEEAWMEYCTEAMLEHERDLDNIPSLSSMGSDDTQSPYQDPQPQNGSEVSHLTPNLRVQQSTLNPEAAEFVPLARTQQARTQQTRTPPRVEKSS